jgi:hypothetical protein
MEHADHQKRRHPGGWLVGKPRASSSHVPAARGARRDEALHSTIPSD